MPAKLYLMPLRKHYVYIYHDPRIKESLPYYVGGGSGDRALFHLKSTKWKRELKNNPHKVNKTQAIIDAGLPLDVRIVMVREFSHRT